MIIEELIRLGRPLLEGGMSAREILELVSDVNDPKVKNFFRHVFVVELPPAGSGRDPVALPLQVWGQEVEVEGKGKRVGFQPDVSRALGAPFTLPAGGNPLNAQGSYGIPVYPCWEAHLRTLPGKEKHSLAESPENVQAFLESRIARTPGFAVAEPLLRQVAHCVHRTVADVGFTERALGLLILADTSSETSAFECVEGPRRDDIGESKLDPKKSIVPRCDRILEAVWSAKLEEGASKGKRPGACSICGRGEKVVSSYCKAWPWALPEWRCPLPQAGNAKLMIEGIALDEPCCRALTLGACLFEKLTRLVHPRITHELFSPADDQEGRETASRRSLSDLPKIRGAAYLLPIHDDALDDDEARDDFVTGISGMLNLPEKRGPLADRYLDTVTGFDVFLPEEVDSDDYRLTLAYFHGDVSRGDIHLRAFIEDVIPSTLSQLRDLARACAENAVSLLTRLSPGASEKQVAYYRATYRSVPYLLARAYGGSYLWDQLETAVRRRPLDRRRPVANAARRMSSLVPRYPETHFQLNDEVVFYLTFLDFLSAYAEQLSVDVNSPQERSTEMAMRPWKELLEAVSHGPVTELRYESPEELGFGCGVLMRQFGRWYYRATEKDLLKHRVLTFGTDLSPEVVWKRGLAKLFDVEARYDKLRISEDFRQRVGATLAEFDRLQDQVRANREAFMSAFWSGHALQGTDQPQTEDAAAGDGDSSE